MIKALRNLLINDVTISELVAGRIYPVRRSEGSGLPAVVLRIEDNAPIDCRNDTDKLSRYLVGVEVHAATYADLDGLCDVLKDLMHGYSGTIGADKIRDIRLAGELDLYEDIQSHYARSLDFYIHF